MCGQQCTAQSKKQKRTIETKVKFLPGLTGEVGEATSWMSCWRGSAEEDGMLWAGLGALTCGTCATHCSCGEVQSSVSSRSWRGSRSNSTIKSFMKTRYQIPHQRRQTTHVAADGTCTHDTERSAKTKSNACYNPNLVQQINLRFTWSYFTPYGKCPQTSEGSNTASSCSTQNMRSG